MKSVYETIRECETKLDELNGYYGSQEEYCIFCKSKEYNGKVGIVHNNDCLMTKIRNELKKYV